MNQDAFIDTVLAVKDHPNADRLSLATIKGFTCAIPRDAMAPGDKALYIAPDAKLDLEKEWAKPFATYLGKGNRVRTVKLRGVLSEGIVVPLDKLPEGAAESENVAEFLGISHWEPPESYLANMGNLQIRSPSLPFALQPTDQENVQQIEPDQILGKAYAVTRKMDGSSCTVAASVGEDGKINDIHVTSRRIDLKLDADNIYTKATKQLVADLMTATFPGKQRIVIRGEVCGAGINANKPNIDCVGSPTLYIFESYFIDNEGRKIYDFNLAPDANHARTVPLLGAIESLTQEHITRYLDAPASEGEGVVLWQLSPNGSYNGVSFKIKSKEYYAKLG